jgi:hypothetical protein
MKSVLKWAKRALCLIMVIALVLPSSHSAVINAASNAITVTNLQGEQLYSGDDLQAAFDAAKSRCIVTISRYVTLKANAVLKVEVMLSGYTYIKFGDYKLQLSENGALFVDQRIRTKYIGALHDYSTVDMIEESGAYIYYLVTQDPSLEGQSPAVSVTGGVLGARVDEQAATIYLDAEAGGITTAKMAKAMSMSAENSEAVAMTFTGSVSINGESCVANGCTVTATATNYDSNKSAKKTYTIILLGDVNGNGRVDAADAHLIVRQAGGSGSLSGGALLAADADQDGAVTAADAELICKKYVKDSYSSPL